MKDFDHLIENMVLKFSMDCDFRASLLLLSSFPELNYYGAFICSISSSLHDLEKKICTPIPFYDMRENNNQLFADKHPVSYTILPRNHLEELNLNILGNLQFILSCTRVSSKFKNSLTCKIDSNIKDGEKIDRGIALQNNPFEGMSCFFGDSIQKANKKEIRDKKRKKKIDKLERKKNKAKLEKKRIFIPHFINNKGELFALNSPIEDYIKPKKNYYQKSERKDVMIAEKLEMEIDSQLDDSGTLLSMVVGEDFSVKMVTKQMIKFSLLMCSDGEDLSNGFIWNEFLPHSKCKDFRLSEGATKILVEPNAGGNSYHSEILSFEVMKRIFNARLENTEMEIEYNPYYSKKTDYSCIISNSVFGVSVTRAMKFGADDDFSLEDGTFLLKKKLYGILISSKNVIKKQKWTRQILHIWCSTQRIATM